MENSAANLPDPDSRPGAFTVVFDGNCGFCRAQVERLARWDRKGLLAFLPLQDPSIPERYPDLTQEQLLKEMVLIEPNGRRHGGAAAFRVLSRKLPRLWWLCPIMHVPFTMPLWQWCYQCIARNRYRLWSKTHPCETGQCSIGHTKQVR